MANPNPKENIKLDPENVKIETLADTIERGWLFLSHENYNRSIEDFTHAVNSDSGDIEAWFGLGLALKASGSKDQAIKAFTKALGVIGNIEDHQRASVLSRLIKGHINRLQTGDWNLTAEVWKKV